MKKVKRSDQVRQAVSLAVRVPHRDRDGYLLGIAEMFALSWGKPIEGMKAYVLEEWKRQVLALAEMPEEADVGLNSRRFSKDHILINEDGEFLGYEGTPDCFTEVEKGVSRGGALKANDRQEDGTWVLMSPYDDRLFGEYASRDEAEQHAGMLQESCIIRFYSKAFGLEVEELTYAPTNEARDFRLDPGKRPDRSSPWKAGRKKRTSAKDADLWPRAVRTLTESLATL